MKLDDYDIQNLNDIEEYSKLQWFVDVSTLSTGDSFGELGLINNEPRTATVNCLTNCYFATLSA